jgi:serine/threonine-protein kinase
VSLPERIGRYRIVGLLGRGARGALYRAEDDSLGRAVALKVLSATAVADADAWARLCHEAEGVMRLTHPNVASLYEVGEHEDIPFVASELLDGIDLRSALAARVHPRATAVIPVVLQVLAGLGHAHDRRIVHRAVSPASIFLPRHRQAKVLDFGLACLGEATGGGKVDRRRDLFCVGLVLHELVTGHAAEGGVPQLTSVPTGREWGRLRGVLRRALAPDGSARYPDAASMAGDLAEALLDLGGPMAWTTPVDSSLFPAPQVPPFSPAPQPQLAHARQVAQVTETSEPAPTLALEPTAADAMAAIADPPVEPSPATGQVDRRRPAVALTLAVIVGLVLLAWSHAGRSRRETAVPTTTTASTTVPETPPATPTPRPKPVVTRPVAAAASVARAGALLEIRRYAEAIVEARAVLRREPNNAEAQEVVEDAQAGMVVDDAIQKARAALKRGDKAAAVEALKKGLAVNDNEARLKTLWRQATE